MKTPNDDFALLWELGHRISAARRRKGRTQKELAQKVGFNQGLVSKIELGKVNTSMMKIRQIKIALDLEWKDLFPEEPIAGS